MFYSENSLREVKPNQSNNTSPKWNSEEEEKKKQSTPPAAGNIFTTPETEENYNGLNINEDDPFAPWVLDAMDPDPESRDAKLDARYAGLTTPGSSMTDPYVTATNVHLQELSALMGIDLTGGISHEQAEQWYFQCTADPTLGRTAGSATTPPGFSSPGTSFTKKKATQEEKNRWAYERKAYLIGEIYKNEANTQLAEDQRSDLQKKIQYWVNRKDLNLSDEQIMKNLGLEIDEKTGRRSLKNYNKLSEMENNRINGSASSLNRSVDFTMDLLPGMIWAARNNSQADPYACSIWNAGGVGVQWTDNPEISKYTDVSSPDYNPFMISGTMHDLFMKYGVNSFDEKWLAENREKLLSTEEGTKDHASIRNALDFTQACIDEKKGLDAWIDYMIDSGASYAEIEDELYKAHDYEDANGNTVKTPKVTHLDELDESVRTGLLKDTTDKIGWSRKETLESVRERIAEHEAKKKGYLDPFEEAFGINKTYYTDPEGMVNPVAAEAMNKFRNLVFDWGNQEDRDLVKTLKDLDTVDEKNAFIESFVTSGALTKEDAFYLHCRVEEEHAAENYLPNQWQINQYDASVKAKEDNLAVLHENGFEGEDTVAMQELFDHTVKAVAALKELYDFPQKLVTTGQYFPGEYANEENDVETLFKFLDNYYDYNTFDLDGIAEQAGWYGDSGYEKLRDFILGSFDTIQSLMSDENIAPEGFPEETPLEAYQKKITGALNAVNHANEGIEKYGKGIDEARTAVQDIRQAFDDLKEYGVGVYGNYTIDENGRTSRAGHMVTWSIERLDYIMDLGDAMLIFDQSVQNDAVQRAAAFSMGLSSEDETIRTAAEADRAKILMDIKKDLDSCASYEKLLEAYGIQFKDAEGNYLDCYQNYLDYQQNLKDNQFYLESTLLASKDPDFLKIANAEKNNPNQATDYRSLFRADDKYDPTDDDVFYLRPEYMINGRDHDPKYHNTNWMSKQEEDVYFYYLGKAREEEGKGNLKEAEQYRNNAEQYRKFINADGGMGNARSAVTAQQNAKKFADELPWLAYAMSFGMNVLSPAGTMYAIKQRLTGQEIDPNNIAFGPTVITNTIREETGEMFDNYVQQRFGMPAGMGKFVFSTGTSGIDSMINSAITGPIFGNFIAGGATKLGIFFHKVGGTLVSTLPMGMQAMSSSIWNSKINGATDDQAMALGLVTLAAETLTEALTFDNITSAFKAGIGELPDETFKQTFKEAILAGLKDAPEEALGEMVNEAVESWKEADILGVKSEYARAVEQYMKDYGLTRENAEKMALKDCIHDVLLAGLSGGLMGIGTSSITYLGGAFSTKIGQLMTHTSPYEYTNIRLRNEQVALSENIKNIQKAVEDAQKRFDASHGKRGKSNLDFQLKRLDNAENQYKDWQYRNMSNAESLLKSTAGFNLVQQQAAVDNLKANAPVVDQPFAPADISEGTEAPAPVANEEGQAAVDLQSALEEFIEKTQAVNAAYQAGDQEGIANGPTIIWEIREKLDAAIAAYTAATERRAEQNGGTPLPEDMKRLEWFDRLKQNAEAIENFITTGVLPQTSAAAPAPSVEQVPNSDALASGNRNEQVDLRGQVEEQTDTVLNEAAQREERLRRAKENLEKAEAALREANTPKGRADARKALGIAKKQVGRAQEAYNNALKAVDEQDRRVDEKNNTVVPTDQAYGLIDNGTAENNQNDQTVRQTVGQQEKDEQARAKAKEDLDSALKKLQEAGKDKKKITLMPAEARAYLDTVADTQTDTAETAENQAAEGTTNEAEQQDEKRAKLDEALRKLKKAKDTNHSVTLTRSQAQALYDQATALTTESGGVNSIPGRTLEENNRTGGPGPMPAGRTPQEQETPSTMPAQPMEPVPAAPAEAQEEVLVADSIPAQEALSTLISGFEETAGDLSQIQEALNTMAQQQEISDENQTEINLREGVLNAYKALLDGIQDAKNKYAAWKEAQEEAAKKKKVDQATKDLVNALRQAFSDAYDAVWNGLLPNFKDAQAYLNLALTPRNNQTAQNTETTETAETTPTTEETNPAVEEVTPRDGTVPTETTTPTETAPTSPANPIVMSLVALNKAGQTNDTSTQLAVVTGILTNRQTAEGVTDGFAGIRAGAAANSMIRTFGAAKTITGMKHAIANAYSHGLDLSVFRSAMTVLALSGNNGLNTLRGLFNGQVGINDALQVAANISTNTEAKAAADAAAIRYAEALERRRLAAENPSDAVAGAERNLENAEAELASAKQALEDKKLERDHRNNELRDAVSEYDRAMDLPATTEQQVKVKRQALESTSRAVTTATEKLGNAMSVVREYEERHSNAARARDTARQAYDNARRTAYQQYSAQAAQNVAAARAQNEQNIAAQMEARRASAEQQVKDAENNAREALQALDDSNTDNAAFNAFVDEHFPGASQEQRAHLRETWNRAKARNEGKAPAKPKESTMPTGVKDSTKALIDRVSKNLGVDVEFRDLPLGKRGYYDKDSNKIVLSDKLDPNDALEQVIFHELTHFAEDSAYYKDLSKYVLDLAYNGNQKQIDADIETRQKVYSKALGVKFGREDARRELVAGLMRNILYGEKSLVDKFCQERPSLAERMLLGIRRVLDKLRGVNLPTVQKLQRARDLFEAALAQRAQTVQEQAANTTHPNSVQYSVEQLGRGLRLLPVYGESGNIIGLQTENGKRVQAGDITADMVKTTPHGLLIQSAIKAGTISQDVADKQLDMIAQLANTCLKYPDFQGMVWEIAGEELYSSIKANADKQYGRTVDFGTICAKTQALIDVMSFAMKEKQRGLTRAEVLMAYAETKKQDLSVPCPVCYVFSRWMGVPSLLNSISQWQKRFGSMSAAEITAWLDDLEARYGADVGENETIGDAVNDRKQKVKNKLSSIEDRIAAIEQEMADATQGLQESLTGKTSEEKKNELIRQLDELETEYKELGAYNFVVQAMLETEKVEIGQKTNDDGDAKPVTKILPKRDRNGNVILNKAFHVVPDDVLFDMKNTAEFAGNPNYSNVWTFRTTRGAGMGKAILPFSGFVVGDLVYGNDAMRRQDPSTIQADKDARGKTGFKPNVFMGQNVYEYNSTHDKHIRPKTTNAILKEGRTAILNALKRNRAQNVIGGHRLQSTSDYRPEWGLDYMMTFLEMQAVGAKAQLYTKVIEAVDFFASVGAEVNMSAMAKGIGYEMGEDGKLHLIFSDSTGINIDQALEKIGWDSEKGAYTTDKGYDNAQIILVGMNDTHIRLALNDDRITFIIPWHASGNSTDVLSTLIETGTMNAKTGEHETLGNGTDYSPFETDYIIGADNKKKQDAYDKYCEENHIDRIIIPELSKEELKEKERLRDIRKRLLTGKAKADDVAAIQALPDGLLKDILSDIHHRFYEEKGGEYYQAFLSSSQAEGIFPHEYWDRSADFTGAHVNGERFAAYCEALGIMPRFAMFRNESGYWKTLIDRRMYGRDGQYHHNQVVDPTNTKVDAIPEEVSVAKYAHRNPQTGEMENLSATETAARNVIANMTENDRRAQEALDNARATLPDQGNNLKYDLDLDSAADTEYENAVASGDMETAQRMTDESAKRNGYTLETFHGTGEYFTEFRRGYEGIHLGNREQAEQVANLRYNNRSKETNYKWSDIRDRVGEMTDEQRESLVKNAYLTQDYFDDGKSVPEFTGDLSDVEAVREYADNIYTRYAAATGDHDVSVRMRTFDRKTGNHVLNLYAKINNPLTINGDIGQWDPASISGVILARADGAETITGHDYQPVDITGSDFSLTEEQRSQLESINFMEVKGDEAWDILSNVLGEIGFDGIKYMNQYEGDKNSYSYIALKQSDVKMSDPVTYDDAGEMIPLSQRFNQRNNDIRYDLDLDQIDADEEGITLPSDDILEQMMLDYMNNPERQTPVKKELEYSPGNPVQAEVKADRTKPAAQPSGTSSGPVQSGDTIMQAWAKALGIPADVRRGKYMRSLYNTTRGYTRNGSGIIHVKDATNMETAAHEMGHVFDEEFGLLSHADTQAMIDKMSQDPRWAEWLSRYTEEERPKEAVAEVMRNWILNRNVAINIAGKDFIDYLEKSLDSRGWLKPTQEAARLLRQNRDATSYERAMAAVSLDVNKESALRDLTEKGWRSVAAEFSDYTFDVDDLSQILKASGKFSEAIDPRTLLLARENGIGNFMDSIMYNTMVDPNGDPVTKADGTKVGNLYNILNKVPQENELEFCTYLLLMHARDRQYTNKKLLSQMTPEEVAALKPEEIEKLKKEEKQIKKVFGDEVDIESAIAIAEQRHPEFPAIAQELYDFYDAFMRAWLVNTNRIPAAEYEAMHKRYPHYVPTFRPGDTADSQTGARPGRRADSGVRSAKGDTRNIYNPVMGLVEYMQRYVANYRQNEIIRALDSMFADPNINTRSIAEPAQSKLEPDYQGATVTNVAANVEKAIKDLKKNGTILPDTAIEALLNAVNETNPIAWLKKDNDDNDVITATLEDGTQRSWTVYDKTIIKALTFMPSTNKAIRLLNAFRGITSFLCSMATSRSLSFGVFNFESDSEEALVTGHSAYTWFDYMAHLSKSFIELSSNKIREFRGEEVDETYRLHKLFGLLGSRYAYRSADTQEETRKKLYGNNNNTALKKILFGNETTVADRAKRIASSPILAIESFSEFLEELSRYNEFRMAGEKGLADLSTYEGRLRAGRMEREVTADFSKRGYNELITAAKAVVPFLGSSIQGATKALTMFSKENEGNRIKIAARLVVNAMLVNAVTAFIRGMTWDDKDKEAYDQLSDYEQNKYYHVKIGDNKFIRIKRSQNPLIQLGSAFGNLIGSTMTGFENDPLGDFAGVCWEIAKNMVIDPTQNVISPIRDVMNNRTYWGGEIENSQMQGRDVADRYDPEDRASPFYRFIGAIIGVSPAKVSYGIGQYTGSLGVVGSKWIGAALENIEKKKGLDQVVIGSLMDSIRDRLAERFSIDPVNTNKINGTYKEAINKLEEIKNTDKQGMTPAQLRGNLTDQERKKAISEAKDLLASGGKVGKLQKEVSELWTEYFGIKKDKTLTDEQKEENMRITRKNLNEKMLKVNEIIGDYFTDYGHVSGIQYWWNNIMDSVMNRN